MANKILIVDDDPYNMELVLEYLENKPDELLYAPNGKRAIDLAIEEKPDLIIMDWEMPVMNGIEAIKELQAKEETKNIPIIIATGVMIRPADLGKALDTGAVDFIKKPFNPIEFNARIRANLRIKEQHELITELMKSDLERKERELSSAAMFAHEKNTMLIKLLEEFEKLELPPDTKVSADLLQIKRQLKSWLNLDKSWNNFKIHFEEVHPDFFATLTQKYESLSTNEKKMCAYLKIGLDNKEIAVLTNVVSGSVRKALNRLKKKLNLDIEDNLREFVSEI